MPRGVIDFTYSENRPKISSGCWLGTRRTEIFAEAFAGMTVLAPAPVKPPGMPCTSSVGRALVRSATKHPGFQVISVLPILLGRWLFSLKGVFFHLFTSGGEGVATRS